MTKINSSDSGTSSSGAEDETSSRQRSKNKVPSTAKERQRNQNRANAEQIIDHPEIMLQMILDIFKTLWSHIKEKANYVMVELGGYKTLDVLAKWLVRNPYGIYILLIIFIASLPFLILLAFGLATVAFTFTGFLVLEGTLLSIISVLLFGCLGALAIVFIFFAILIVATYLGFAHIYDLFGGSSSSGPSQAKATLMSYLLKERSTLVRKFQNNINDTGTGTNTNDGTSNNAENIETVAH